MIGTVLRLRPVAIAARGLGYGERGATRSDATKRLGSASMAGTAAAAALVASPGSRACGRRTAMPEPGQIGFQKAVTPIAAEIHWFHNDILLPIIIVDLPLRGWRCS